MSARLPLAVAAVVLATAFVTSQIAMQSLSRQVERQLDRMGQIYLDGLAAALFPPVIRGDVAGIDRALDESLRIHQGLVERRLFVLDASGRVLARADRAGLPDVELLEAATQAPRGHALQDEDGSYWVWRPLADERIAAGGAALTVVANLDVADYVAERQRLWWQVALFSLGLGFLCALLGLVLMRRLLRPLDLLTQHLQQGGQDGPLPVAAGRIPTRDPETARLLQAYNRMAGATREREALLTRMAEQEREAVLGRMAATLAHEVRNPLSGVLTAIDTLRKFGDQPHARAEALDFMERGMRALADVADATLATHRLPGDVRAFGPQDIRDVERLVAPQAERAGVLLSVESELQQIVPVAGGEVRQVLLNLLLNALKASSPGGRVILRCALQGGHLRLEVRDEGNGLSPEMARSLEQGDEPAGTAGLGVAVIVRLVQRLQGRVAVDAHSGQGTRITLELPFDSSHDFSASP